MKLRMFEPFDRMGKLNTMFLEDRGGARWAREVSRRAEASGLVVSDAERNSGRFPTALQATNAVFFRYEAAFRFLDVKRWGTIIDLGCGNGLPAYLLSDVADRVIGIDIDEERIAVASKLFPEVEFYTGELETVLEQQGIDKVDVIINAFAPIDYGPEISARCRYFLHVGYIAKRGLDVFLPSKRLSFLNLRFDTVVFGEGCRGFSAMYFRRMFRLEYLLWIRRIFRKKGYILI
jgi:SAM-dependent methyltransferase